jgi:type I restriction enzyme S subunit
MSDVPEGYRMSEVGVIPKDWEVKQLGEMAKITMGQSPKSVFYNINGDGLPLIQGNADIENRTTIIRTFTSSITKKGKNGDIIMSVRAPVGEIARATFDCCLGRGVCAVSYKNDYLYHYLIHFEKFWTKLSKGSTFDSINSKEVNELEIALPKLDEEQQAIASALNDVDALIAALEQLITKKRNIKQGAMQQLLSGEKRLPGFSGEWKVKVIGKEIDLLTGFPFSSSQYSSCGIKLLRGSNIKRGVTDWSDDITEFWEGITPDLKNYILNEGDIVIAMDGSLVGRSFAILSKKDLPALLLQRVARIRSNKIDVGYLKEFICSDYFSKYCDSVKTVTAIPHISPDDIRNFTILLPPSKEEQQAIAQILSDMDTEIESLKQKRNKYKAIKQGMMQELLTGKTRLI